MRPLLKHFELLEDAFAGLTPAQAFAFGAACAERQWPVYERAAAGKPWAAHSTLRSTLDGIWDWLLGVGARPRGTAASCDEAVPEEIVDEAEGAAREVAGSFLSLAYAVDEDKPGECLQAASNGLNLVEAFVYDYLGLRSSTENDLFVDEHELVRGEIRRQEDDLKLVAGAPLSPQTVSELRDRSRGRSVLGDFWY